MPASEPTNVPAAVRRGHAWAVSMFVAAALVVGIAAAVAWRLIVRLPTYLVQPDGSATVSERALTAVFASVAWYVMLGIVGGLGLGVVTWHRFKNVGWLSALLAAGLGLVSGLVCWQLGQLLGGAPFDERLATARPGDSVTIALALRSPSALAVWAFAAVTPILLGSALGADDEAGPREPRPRRRRRVEQVQEQREVVDELGVVRTDAAGSAK